jgi:hypothetical protein
MDPSSTKPNAHRLDGRLLAELEAQFKTGPKNAFGPSAVVRRAIKAQALAEALGQAIGRERDLDAFGRWLRGTNGRWIGDRRILSRNPSAMFIERRKAKAP